MADPLHEARPLHIDVEIPKCPVCESTSKRCKRPSEHEATQWHVEREDALAKLCGCAVCKAWLKRRRKR